MTDTQILFGLLTYGVGLALAVWFALLVLTVIFKLRSRR